MTVLIVLCVVALNVPAAESPEEKDFIARLENFQKAGDMAGEEVAKIYEVGTTPKELLDNYKNLEAMIVRGIESVKFQEIFPVIREKLKSPTGIDGSGSVPNLEPYKMVTIEYKTKIKNGSAGVSLLTGTKGGKIFICGYKKKS